MGSTAVMEGGLMAVGGGVVGLRAGKSEIWLSGFGGPALTILFGSWFGSRYCSLDSSASSLPASFASFESFELREILRPGSSFERRIWMAAVASGRLAMAH